jgi:hypothetical protein
MNYCINHSDMNAIITAAPALISIAEESKKKVRKTSQAASSNTVRAAEIEKAERYFKAIRQIEFLTLII